MKRLVKCDNELEWWAVGRAIGFTGTRKGMTVLQMDAIKATLAALEPPEVHHGGCIGADCQFHQAVLRIVPNAKIVVHPCDIESARGDFEITPNVEVREPKPPLIRNHDIVDETEVLLATPLTNAEMVRSGTWATVRYARSRGRAILIELRGAYDQPYQG